MIKYRLRLHVKYPSLVMKQFYIGLKTNKPIIKMNYNSKIYDIKLNCLMVQATTDFPPFEHW